MSDSCCTSTITTVPNGTPTGTLVQRLSADGKVNKGVERVLVTAEDVTVTLPYQPPAGTAILVTSRSTGTTVEPGCAPECSCDSSDDDPECDTFCDESESVSVAECGQVLFVYFPGDPCADPATEGVWSTSAE